MGTYEKIMADVRESRVRMSEKCGHDVERLLDYLQSFEMKYSKQVTLLENPTAPGHRASSPSSVTRA